MSILATTGTITTATSTVAASMNGDAQLLIAVYGTYTGVSVIFEGSCDNTNWFKLQAFRSDTYQAESFTSGALALPNSVSRAWFLLAGSFTQVRVRATAWSTGTANVIIQEGPVNTTPVVQPAGQGLQFYMPAGKLTGAIAATAGVVPIVAGNGILDRIVITSTATTGSLTVFDNATTNSGTQLYGSSTTVALGTIVELKVPFSNGITANSPAGAAAATFSYLLF